MINRMQPVVQEPASRLGVSNRCTCIAKVQVSRAVIKDFMSRILANVIRHAPAKMLVRDMRHHKIRLVMMRRGTRDVAPWGGCAFMCKI